MSAAHLIASCAISTGASRLKGLNRHGDAGNSQGGCAVVYLPQVVGALVAQPALGALAKGQLQAHGHLGREPSACVDQLGHRFTRHLQGLLWVKSQLREAPLEEVLRVVCEGLQWLSGGKAGAVQASKSAISQARTRLGPEVMRQLAQRVLRPLGVPGSPGTWYRGLPWRPSLAGVCLAPSLPGSMG